MPDNASVCNTTGQRRRSLLSRFLQKTHDSFAENGKSKRALFFRAARPFKESEARIYHIGIADLAETIRVIGSVYTTVRKLRGPAEIGVLERHGRSNGDPFQHYTASTELCQAAPNARFWLWQPVLQQTRRIATQRLLRAGSFWLIGCPNVNEFPGRLERRHR